VSAGSPPWSPARFWPWPLERSRAHSSAVSVAVEAESWITPVNDSGSPTMRRSHSITTSSTSVAAGLVCQLIPWAPSPAAARSPSTEA
jgi:hypothetical protein